MADMVLVINLDNDEVATDPPAAVARLLREAADRIECRGISDGGQLRDINGNNVGGWFTRHTQG